MDFLMLRVNTASDIWRLMAQTAIQPGVANVYCAVVQQSRGSASLMVADHAKFDFQGQTYKCAIDLPRAMAALGPLAARMSVRHAALAWKCARSQRQ